MKILAHIVGVTKVTGPAVRVDRWYDRHQRIWTLQFKDANDFPIGDAQYSGTRVGAEHAERRMIERLQSGEDLS